MLKSITEFNIFIFAEKKMKKVEQRQLKNNK